MTDNRDRCPAELDLERVTSSIDALVTKMDSLLSMHRDVVRWLLVVVCVIALGRSAVDLGKEFIERGTRSALAESTE